DLSVRAGDIVAEGQTLLEIEAEKSTVEVPAPVAGRVAKFLVGKGDKILVGQAICLIEAAGQQDGASDAAARQGADGKHAAKQAMRRNGADRADEASPKEPRTEGSPAGAAAREDKPAAGATQKEATTPSGHPGTKPAAPKPDRLVAAGPATRRLARELGVNL